MNFFDRMPRSWLRTVGWLANIAALAWWPCWVAVAAIAAAGRSFTLSGGPQIGAFYVGFAVVVGTGLALARTGTSREETPS